MAFIQKHPLALALIPLLLISLFLSYNRFVVENDYVVAYEGDCDPATESCFVGCEDDACAEQYYYTTIEKHAAELREVCGTDITDCEEAYSCQETDAYCEVTYCDASTDDCYGPTGITESEEEEDESEEATGEGEAEVTEEAL